MGPDHARPDDLRDRQGTGARQAIVVTAVVKGAFSEPGPKNPNPKTSPEQAPQMHFMLLRHRPAQDDEPSDSETTYPDPKIIAPHCDPHCMTWSASFGIPKSDYETEGDSWSIFVEEVDRFRPASYRDEPRYEARTDTNFVDFGPRFAARLSLDNLAVK